MSSSEGVKTNMNNESVEECCCAQWWSRDSNSLTDSLTGTTWSLCLLVSVHGNTVCDPVLHQWNDTKGTPRFSYGSDYSWQPNTRGTVVRSIKMPAVQSFSTICSKKLHPSKPWYDPPLVEMINSHHNSFFHWKRNMKIMLTGYSLYQTNISYIWRTRYWAPGTSGAWQSECYFVFPHILLILKKRIWSAVWGSN